MRWYLAYYVWNKNKTFECFYLQNLTDANDAYEAQIKDLRGNLDDAISQMDRTTEDYLKLKVRFKRSLK